LPRISCKCAAFGVQCEEAAGASKTVPRRFMEAFWKRSPVDADSELRL